MKLSKKNKSLYNHSLKRQITNTQKNLNLFPLLFQISKKNFQHTKLIKEDISLGIQNKNINNVNNNNNKNHSLSNSSLLINFFSPVHNPHFFQNKKNKHMSKVLLFQQLNLNLE